MSNTVKFWLAFLGFFIAFKLMLVLAHADIVCTTYSNGAVHCRGYLYGGGTGSMTCITYSNGSVHCR